MVEKSQNEQPLTGYAITQPNYKNNPRYFLIERKAIFKKVRVEGGSALFVEMANELVCNSLGISLGMPLVPTFLGVLPSQGVGLL